MQGTIFCHSKGKRDKGSKSSTVVKAKMKSECGMRSEHGTKSSLPESFTEVSPFFTDNEEHEESCSNAALAQPTKLSSGRGKASSLPPEGFKDLLTTGNTSGNTLKCASKPKSHTVPEGHFKILAMKAKLKNTGIAGVDLLKFEEYKGAYKGAELGSEDYTRRELDNSIIDDLSQGVKECPDFPHSTDNTKRVDEPSKDATKCPDFPPSSDNTKREVTNSINDYPSKTISTIDEPSPDATKCPDVLRSPDNTKQENNSITDDLFQHVTECPDLPPSTDNTKGEVINSTIDKSSQDAAEREVNNSSFREPHQRREIAQLPVEFLNDPDGLERIHALVGAVVSLNREMNPHS